VSEKKISLKRMPVERLMGKPVKTVEGGKSFEDSLKAMRKDDVGCVIVTEGGAPVGIITERDVLRRVADDPGSLRLTMREVMSKPLRSVTSATTVWDAMEAMEGNKIRHLAVVDGGELVGVLTERDILRLFLANKNLLLDAIGKEETRRFMLGE
jgi:CBS domain-containing protein